MGEKMPQQIIVTEYNPAWPQMFKLEMEAIKKTLGENCLAIHHIGSTAVVGLAAKPIIDIMPVVKSLNAVDKVSKDFEALGYEYMGEFGIAGRRYLRKGGDERTHQIHIFEESNTQDIQRHLAVRDYLRCHPEAAYEYGELKLKLAREFPYDIDGYCDGKDEFVRGLELQAIKWKRELGDMNEEWKRLYDAALSVIKPKELSKNILVGSVGAAVLTKSGNIYTGICIDTSCSLGMCAERNALSTMLTDGKYMVDKVCAVYEDGSLMPPCGACREFMMQLGDHAKEIEILLDKQGKTLKLKELLPEYQY